MLDTDKSELIKYWNSYFNYNYDMTNVNEYYDVDGIFNDYLLANKTDYELTDEICFCKKVDSDYLVYYVKNNKVVSDNFNVRAKRKLSNLINNYSVIIVDGFSLSEDLVSNNKIILRYELIRNIFTSNHTHFLSDSLRFSIDDNTVFFTKMFYIELFSNNNRLNQLKFTSYVLNSFEKGVSVDDIILKPNINVSQYGRWYWSGTEKIQNDSKARNKIYNKLLKYGKVMNIDLINGEPWILSQMSGSKTIKKLIKARIKLNSKGEHDLGNIIKNLLNIYIHSVNKPNVANAIFQSKNNSEDIKKIEKVLNCKMYDVICNISNELEEYNKNIIDSYKNNLSVTEFDRRIVNPATILMSEKEIIKEHRKYLQGHTHDRILLLAQGLYNNLGLIPMFTIHDSITYFINNHDEAPILDCVNKIAKNIKTPITIEILGE